MESNNRTDIVHFQLDQPKTSRPEQSGSSKAVQIKVNDRQTVIVYNRVQRYILDAVLKAVFPDAN